MPVYRHLGIDTGNEYVIFIRMDSEICLSEGFEALTRVSVTHKKRSIVASIQVITDTHILDTGEASLSISASNALKIKEGERLVISHLSEIKSIRHVRSKIYGNDLSNQQFTEIIADIVEGKYANVHLSAFITACAGDSLSTDEITGLTKAMVEAGEKMKWKGDIIADKHCVGGLPGNRTTPIVVSIIAAAGLVIPKTSSHAITSPAGTADMMSVITRVKLRLDEMKAVVNEEGGCIVSGEQYLSPADDIIIRVERALDIDSEGQMIASVLSKKAAAGSTHLIIDIPVGPTAKVRSEENAEKLKFYFKVVGKALGIRMKILITDGREPIGSGIGPALEAMDVLAVLRNEKDSNTKLREKSLMLSGQLLELAKKASEGKGYSVAKSILESGAAFEKFVSICNAQGGFHEPQYAVHKKQVLARKSGVVTSIDNRKLAKLAKLAGAPSDPSAGVHFEAFLGRKISKGDVLYTIYAESPGELDYALNYLSDENHIITLDGHES